MASNPLEQELEDVTQGIAFVKKNLKIGEQELYELRKIRGELLKLLNKVEG